LLAVARSWKNLLTVCTNNRPTDETANVYLSHHTDAMPGNPPMPNHSMFIKVIQHSHAKTIELTIIPLNGQNELDTTQKNSVFPPAVKTKPWALFCTRADFEYTEMAIKGLLSKNIVDVDTLAVG
jgi:hypothetical protein